MELIFSLIAGLMIAFALQLLLANLGIALGLTVLDFSPRDKPSSDSRDISLPITHLLGVGVALTLTTVLFAAGLLTTEFSEIAEPRRGLIFGIILWAAYWLLFIWLSSTTLSTIADSLLGAALSNGRRLINAIFQGVGSKAPESDEQKLLRQLSEEVSELAKRQQQLPLSLAEQQKALLAEMRRLAAVDPTPPAKTSLTELETPPSASASFSSSAPPSSPNLMSRLNLPSGRQLLQRAIDHVDMPDISDIDVQALWHQLRSDDPDQAIQLDVSDYLRQTPAWMLQPEILRETFYERIYDPDAAPEQVKAQLAAISRTHFVDWLRARGDLAAEQVETVADLLSQVKETVMTAMPPGPTAADPAVVEKIQEKLMAYCRYTNLDVLTPDRLDEKVRSQLEEHAVEDGLKLDLEAIETILNRRQGLDSAGQKMLMDALRSALSQSAPRSSLPSSPQRPAPRRWATRSGQSAKHVAEQLATQVTYYLRHQDKAALQPDHMARDLTDLAKASLGSVAQHLPDSFHLPDSWFDKTVWKHELEKRRDLTTAEIQQILAGTESVWQQTLQNVGTWGGASWSEVQESLKSQNDALLGAASQQISQGLSAVQETLENQVDAVKEDLQTQADAARGQVAIASWWLFSSLLLSGISAAASGWLAVIY